MAEPKFMPEGRLPTWEDVERLALFDPIAHYCISMHRHELLTQEQALLILVLALADAKRDALDRLLECLKGSPGHTLIRW
jgi:hypothetical protein